MDATFKKATRQSVKIKLAVTGPSGSGKTEGALCLAEQLVPGRQIALIDTENGSASLYGDRHNFDVLDLSPPFLSKKFTDALDAAIAGGYDVVVIDSMSHQWDGSGGILDRKNEEDRNKPGANSFAMWSKYKEEHRKFIAHILQSPIHVIACIRSKQEYIQDGEKVQKVGMAPITGESAEYEFSTVFDLTMEHKAAVSKDRTGLFDGRFIDFQRDKPGEEIAKWLASGVVIPVAGPETQQAVDEALESMRELGHPKYRAFKTRWQEVRARSTETNAQSILGKILDANQSQISLVA